jgi:hypothetical protein
MKKQHLWSLPGVEGICKCSCLFTICYGYGLLCFGFFRLTQGIGLIYEQVLCCVWSIGWILQHWLWCFYWNGMISHYETWHCCFFFLIQILNWHDEEWLLFQNNLTLQLYIECLLFHLDFWNLHGERWPWTNSRWCVATWEKYACSWLLHVWKLLHGMMDHLSCI